METAREAMDRAAQVAIDAIREHIGTVRWVVTFPVGGPLADRYAVIEAADEMTARLAVMGVYGQRGWAGMYRADAEAQAMVERYGLRPVALGFGREIAEDY